MKKPLNVGSIDGEGEDENMEKSNNHWSDLRKYRATGGIFKNLSAMKEIRGSILGWGRTPGEWNGNPLQYFCLENSMDRETWHATVHGVAKSQT